jgi:hypothetical protein
MFNAWMNTSNVGRTTSRPFCGWDVEAIAEGVRTRASDERLLRLKKHTETCPFDAAAQILVNCFCVDGQLELQLVECAQKGI